MITIEVLSGFMTLFIAGFASYIAYQQYILKKQLVKLDSQKIKFELYEKRYRIYYETKSILHKINQNAKIDLIELRDFRFKTDERIFLFESDINELIEEIKTKAIELNHSTDKLKDLNLYPVNSQEREQQINIDSELTKWFTNEYENIENRLVKYLDFKNL